MFNTVFSAAEDSVPVMTVLPLVPGMVSLARAVRLLRGAHVPVSLVRFASRQIDPLMLESSLEDAIGLGGMVEPLGGGAVLAILPRFGEEPSSARWRMLVGLQAVLSREGIRGPIEIEIAELHCWADALADCEDLQLQLLAAKRRTISLLASIDGAG